MGMVEVLGKMNPTPTQQDIQLDHPPAAADPSARAARSENANKGWNSRSFLANLEAQRSNERGNAAVWTRKLYTRLSTHQNERETACSFGYKVRIHRQNPGVQELKRAFLRF